MALATVLCRSSYLSYFYGRTGIGRVLANDLSGWDDIAKAAAYRFWAVKISATMFFKRTFLHTTGEPLSSEIRDAACLLAYYLATENKPKQAFLVDMLVKSVMTPGAISTAFWKERQFEPFILRLYQKQTGTGLPDAIVQMDIGVYKTILEDWNRPLRAEYLTEICEYHCRNMRDRSNWYSEFGNSPFDLVPSEVVAIYLVRRTLGLETAEIVHALMKTGLEIIKAPKYIEDPFLQRVEDIFDRVFL